MATKTSKTTLIFQKTRFINRCLIHSVPLNTIQIPTHGKYQFHVTPKLNKHRLLSLLESDNENISHRYNSIALKEILEFSSLSHKITFPLHLSCDLPELKISCSVINFGDVFYGKSVAKEFSITNTSSHCQSWYQIQNDDNTKNFEIDSEHGRLAPGETHRIQAKFCPDGKQLNYSANLKITETLLGKINNVLVLNGVASFDSRGLE